MVYGSWSRGYRSGGFSPRAATQSGAAARDRARARGRRLAAQRQRDPDRDEHAAAGLVEAPPHAPKPGADAMGHAGNEDFGGNLDDRECSGRMVRRGRCP